MTRRTTAAGEAAKQSAPKTPSKTPSQTQRKPSPADASQLPVPSRQTPQTPLTQRLARPQSVEEADARYVAARDAWTAAMRAANSGRSADLASLAIAQEAYEAAAAEY